MVAGPALAGHVHTQREREIVRVGVEGPGGSLNQGQEFGIGMLVPMAPGLRIVSRLLTRDNDDDSQTKRRPE